jgi:hypothetical protein
VADLVRGGVPLLDQEFAESRLDGLPGTEDLVLDRRHSWSWEFVMVRFSTRMRPRTASRGSTMPRTMRLVLSCRPES